MQEYGKIQYGNLQRSDLGLRPIVALKSGITYTYETDSTTGEFTGIWRVSSN